MEGTQQASPCSSGLTNLHPTSKPSTPNPFPGQEIIYAWAKNAPKLTLPPGVGFQVGGPDSKVQYLVLQVRTFLRPPCRQVHYASVSAIPPEGDESGVLLRYTNRPQPRRAGVYFLGTGGVIPSRATQYMEVACRLSTRLTIHPFAFRTHTHALGRVVSGWKVGDGWMVGWMDGLMDGHAGRSIRSHRGWSGSLWGRRIPSCRKCSTRSRWLSGGVWHPFHTCPGIIFVPPPPNLSIKLVQAGSNLGFF
jgi:hypothetical protein